MRKGSYSEELIRNKLEEHMVLCDHVGIPVLQKAMTCQGRRPGARGASGMRTEAQDHEAPLIRTSRAAGHHSEQSCNLSRVQGWMKGGPHALEEGATHRREMLSPILSVRTLAGCRGQHHAGVSLCRKTAVKFVQRLL